MMEERGNMCYRCKEFCGNTLLFLCDCTLILCPKCLKKHKCGNRVNSTEFYGSMTGPPSFFAAQSKTDKNQEILQVFHTEEARDTWVAACKDGTRLVIK